MSVALTRRWVLFYDYVPDVLERRAPHRDAHLALIRDWKADGRILDAGALGDPPHGGLFVFATESADEIASFVEEDPYVANGIVTGHRVEPWMVVG
jgi:uncharacterized protein